jgi:hypothetical protein
MDLEGYKKELHSNYEKWNKAFLKNKSRGRDAIGRIDSLSINDPEESRLRLVADVSAVCYRAANYNSPLLTDFARTYREENKSILEEIPLQLKSLKTLKRFISVHPEHSTMAFENPLCEKGEESNLYKALVNQDAISSANDLLIEIFSLYEEGLRHLNDGLYEIRQEGLPMDMISGSLIYPKSLNKRELGANPEENNLLFHLAFIFREFTNPNFKHENLPFKIEGELPDHGKPCYRLIADLANAVFFPEGNQEYEGNEFTETKVKERINLLKDKKVKIDPRIIPPSKGDY